MKGTRSDPPSHSEAIELQNLRATPGRSTAEPRRLNTGTSRRSSISSSVSSLARSMSARLSLVQRRSGRSRSLDFRNCDLQIDKNLMERALIRHFDDPSIKVRISRNN